MTNLQKMRKAAGMSQSELARAAGLSLRTLQALESGARDINKLAVRTALNIAKTLNCSVEEILEP